jgi:DNA-binding response OmpR family regulator
MILVVDDEPAIRELLRTVLVADGHEVAVAEDALAALALAARREPELVVSDLCMPGASGLDLLVELRASGVKAPFVLSTGSDPSEYRSRATALAVDAILPKPLSLTDLRRTVAALASPRAA